jgi:hypothetical protein
MARNKTLVRILDELRVEARLSLNPSHNTEVRDPQIIMLQREQERLWEDFDWPHLRVTRFIPVQSGQRFYDPLHAINLAGTPTSDLTIDKLEKIEFKDGGAYFEVKYGIEAGHYATTDSDLGAESWPVCRWSFAEDDQLEVWPVPDADADADDHEGYLKLTGIRNLRPFVADSDRADLDSRLLVLYVAGNILAAQGAKDAQIKLEAANDLRGELLGNQVKTRRFKMFGIGSEPRPRRPFITRYVAPE